MYRTLACVLLCFAAQAQSALAQQAAMQVEQALAVLDGLAEKRAQIAREEQSTREACYAKFASSSCLKAAARTAQDKRASLRQEENAARRVLREDRAAKQKARVQEKSAQPAPQPTPMEKRPPLVQPKAPANGASPPAAKRPPLQNLSPQQVAANEAAHAKRLADAKAKQEEIKKKQAERAAKKTQQSPPPSAGKL